MGRGILVVQGFCQVSRFLVGAKTTGHHIPNNMGMCKLFFKDATKIQNGHQRSTLKFVSGA